MTKDYDRPIVIIKVGGANLVDLQDIKKLAEYVEGLMNDGCGVAIVHGGGPEISRLHQALSIPYEKKEGLRVTSNESMEIVSMVLCGTVNKRIVGQFNRLGIKAIGLCGIDGGLLRTDLLDPGKFGRVGRTPQVKGEQLKELLALGYIPVLAPVSLGTDGLPVNVNADDAAFAVAVSLCAASIDFISDVPGVQDQQQNTIQSLYCEQVPELITSKVVRGGMIPKLQAASAAIAAGVGQVRIGDFDSMIANTSTEITQA